VGWSNDGKGQPPARSKSGKTDESKAECKNDSQRFREKYKKPQTTISCNYLVKGLS